MTVVGRLRQRRPGPLAFDFRSEEEAVRGLLDATTLVEARSFVDALVGLGYTWVPLGGKEGNYGLVNIGSDPGLAFVERVTNALDAVLERRAAHADPAVLASLDSPRDAARELFAIPDGRLSNLDPAARTELAQTTTITVVDGARADRPTLEVRDFGIGIAPGAMADTILNLAGSNKLAKPYLAGAYGQGGSTTFAFAPGGTTIASATDTSATGVTFVRYRELDPRRNKNGRYEYLVRPSGGGVPHSGGAFRPGTLVRHFDYELPGARVFACDRESGLAALLDRALFDPILPFCIAEARQRFAGEPERCIISSGRYTALQSAAHSEVVYRHASDVVMRSGRRAEFVAVRYWVLGSDDSPLHPDRRNPIAVTSFGQTHGTLDRRFITEACKLPYLKASLVVQIELEALAPATKRELLSSTRDRLKNGAALDRLIESVRDALLDDTRLAALNVERRRALLERTTPADQARLRRRFVELLDKFRPGPEPALHAAANGASSAAPSGGGESDAEAIALPTFDRPTFIRIAAAALPLQLAAGRTNRIPLESDAPDGYLTQNLQARLVLVAEPLEACEFVRAADFRGGRSRMSVRAQAALGTTGFVTVRLTDADGTVLTDRAPFVIVAPPEPERAGEDGRKGARVPDIVQVFRSQWESHGFDETSVAEANESRDDYTIFVNMDNLHLVRLIASVDYQETGLARMRSSFLVQTAFYAFLLNEARKSFPALDETGLEAYQLGELDRVARTIVSSIASVERIESQATIDLA